jgi:hypothetical protein
MAFVIIALIGLIVLIPSNNDSVNRVYCRMECWSERKPCCLSS